MCGSVCVVSDRVVDELAPERHLIVNDIVPLLFEILGGNFKETRCVHVNRVSMHRSKVEGSDDFSRCKSMHKITRS